MTEKRAMAAAAAADGSMVKQIGKQLRAVGHFESSLSLARHPPCSSCGLPASFHFEIERDNAGELTSKVLVRDDPCACGASAPAQTDRQNVAAVMPDHLFPRHAKLLFWIGDSLRRLALWLERS